MLPISILLIIFCILIVNKTIYTRFFTIDNSIPIFYLSVLFLFCSKLYLIRDITNTTILTILFFSLLVYAQTIVFTKMGIEVGSTYIKKNVGLDIDKLNRISLSLAIFCMLYLAYYLPGALKIFLLDGLSTYRMEVNGFSGDGSILFGKGLTLFFYQFVFKGLVVSLSIISSIIFFQTKKKTLLVCITLVVLFDCIISLGRFIVYYHFIAFMITGLCLGKLSIKQSFKYVFLLITFTLFFTLFRFESFSDLSAVIVRNFVGYHVFGLALFDTAINSSNLVDNNWSGISAFANFQFIVARFLQFAGIENNTFMMSSVYRSLGNFSLVGTDPFGNSVYANAFYTNFYDFFLDGGYYSLVIYCLFLSTLYSLSLMLAKKYPTNFILKIFYIYMFLMLYFGLFNSQFLLVRNVFLLFFLVFLIKTCKSKKIFHEKLY